MYIQIIVLVKIKMQLHIQKWGNSLGLRIPMKILQHLKLQSGSAVDIKLQNDHIVISPQRCFVLEDMISQITTHNLHDEDLSDDSQGRESW